MWSPAEMLSVGGGGGLLKGKGQFGMAATQVKETETTFHSLRSG